MRTHIYKFKTTVASFGLLLILLVISKSLIYPYQIVLSLFALNQFVAVIFWTSYNGIKEEQKKKLESY